MDDDLTRNIGAPLAGDDEDVPPEEDVDDLDDNFDRELREAERDLEETDIGSDKNKKSYEEIDEEE